MLDDRSYMRSSPADRRPVTVTLLLVLVAIYVIESCLILYNPAFKGWFSDCFGLSLAGIAEGKVWQLFTFQMLHDAPVPFHLLFNGLGLFFFGRVIEEALGSRRFLLLYFLSGTFGGGVQLLSTWLH